MEHAAAAALAPVTHRQPAAHAQSRFAAAARRSSSGAVRLQTLTFRHLRSWRVLSSAAPETETTAAAVYGGGGSSAAKNQPQPPSPSSAARRVTVTTLRGKHRRGEPITMVTAYDYPSAVHVDTAGVDLILVGDSAAMVAHGHDNTLPIPLDVMLHHCRAVVRGAPRPLVVGDLPFGSYESSPAQAVESAVRLVKEGGVDAVKMEGGSPSRVAAARAIVEAGIAVMGHVGLTPQAISVLGGFRAQGKTVNGALKVVEAALALQDAGCFAVVLECVPAPVAAAATAALQIPTIGIGAGPLCSGQVLVYHDLLGMFQSPDHSKVTPKFCKQFGNIGVAIGKALAEYREQVEAGSFPDADHTPYKISSVDVDVFADALRNIGFDGAAAAAAAAAGKTEEIVGSGKPHNGDINNNGVLSSAGAAV